MRKFILITIVAIVAATTFAQGTFSPRDADEEQAWRIHSKYKESRKKEDELTGQIALLRRDIATQSASTIGAFGSDAKDRERLTKLREQLAAEQANLRKLEADWDKKFYGRYGYLQDSDATIVDPVTKRTMDKIEFRLINFPFNDKKKPTAGTRNAASGVWQKVREKLWTFTSTPNEPDERQEQSGAPFEITYTNHYYDRNNTKRWLKDTSHVSCTSDLLNADNVAPGQKVIFKCSLAYKAEHYTSGTDAAVWVGDIPIQTPAGFRSDGTLYPFWGYRTDSVVSLHVPNNGTGDATGRFSFPTKPSTDNEPFCIRLTSGIHGTAAAEVCYQWNAGPTANPPAGDTKKPEKRPPSPPEGIEVSIFGNMNTGGVGNSPSAPTKFTISTPQVITYVMTYHWNSGRGTPVSGTISLRAATGTIYGPWGTTGSAGQGGVPNAFWEARPKITIPAGEYTVLDSSPGTWAQNRESGGRGHAIVKGYAVSGDAPMQF